MTSCITTPGSEQMTNEFILRSTEVGSRTNARIWLAAEYWFIGSKMKFEYWPWHSGYMFPRQTAVLGLNCSAPSRKKLRLKGPFLKIKKQYWTSTNSFSFVDLKIFNASDLHWNTFLTFTQPLKILMTVYRGGDCLPFVGSKNSILFEWFYFWKEL